MEGLSIPKIIKHPKNIFEPVVCKICGCKYEFKTGDKIEHTFVDDETKAKNNEFALTSVLALKCPVCCKLNEIKRK